MRESALLRLKQWRLLLAFVLEVKPKKVGPREVDCHAYDHEADEI
jgi:hypothetical protein